ncbi:hypothetical protein B0T21DRAFT_356182 [Apiosordaria backusii]|uniref:Uncharacterized protein n=1 Tax=Apiosordaria backusii TaxID=314023 RepID=A0AA40EZ75_9PEZI|nr:hypothetical protein B0T21DRAFT_356182 [Apiosordaria backusii]
MWPWGILASAWSCHLRFLFEHFETFFFTDRAAKRNPHRRAASGLYKNTSYGHLTQVYAYGPRFKTPWVRVYILSFLIRRHKVWHGASSEVRKMSSIYRGV